MDQEVSRFKDVADKNELLLWACTRGLLPDALALLQAGAEASATEQKTGRRPVHYAASQGHLDILEYLASKGVDVDAEDPRGRSPLHYAAAQGHAAAAQYLMSKAAWLEATDDGDDTALHLAARTGSTAVVKALVGAGAKLSLPNSRGLTPVAEALLGSHVSSALLLMDAGAKVLDFKARGFTLLHLVAGLGQCASVELLLRQAVMTGGADAATDAANEQSNEEGATPLHAAALGGCAECVELLVKHGADGTLLDAEGRMPVDLLPADPAGAAAAAPSRLHELLSEAGRKTKNSMFSFGGTAKKKAPTPAAAAGDGSGGGEELDPSAEGRFSRMKRSDQLAKVNTYGRMEESELAQLPHLSDIARIAINQIRKVSEVLMNWQAIGALRHDEEFQADVVDPAVLHAMEVLKANPGDPDRYATDPAVMSVLSKLKKLHGAMQRSSMKVGLEDLMVHKHPDNSLEKTDEQISSLQASLERAREDAIAVLSGLEPPSVITLRKSRAAAAAAEAAAAAAEEQAKAAPTPTASSPAAPSAGGKSGASGGAAAKKVATKGAAGVTGGDAGVRAGGIADGGLLPDALAMAEPETWKELFIRAGAEVLWQVTRSFGMGAIMMGALWYWNLLPSQQVEQEAVPLPAFKLPVGDEGLLEGLLE